MSRIYYDIVELTPSAEYKAVSDRLGDDDRTWWEVKWTKEARIGAWTVVKDVFAHLPQVRLAVMGISQLY